MIARFDWIVDYAQRRLWCRPNARHAAPFEWPVAGASFEWRDGAIAVTAVVDGSPAAVAGLRQGDRIVGFGDRDFAASPPHDNVVEGLRNYVKQLDAKVHVAVLRGDARQDLEWTTRRLR